MAVRTGDTPQRDRQRMLRTPPDVLITTPESLFLLLTSRGRDVLAGVRSVIVDEIHAVAGTKRGTHLALSLERLERVVAEDGGSLQRIGLSATQRPLSEIARFLGGQDDEGRPRPVTIVDAGAAKELDLRVIVPVEDMRELGTGAPPLEPDVAELVEGEARTRSIWPAMYPELLELVKAHRSTLIFVNNRRLAERLALRLNELAGEEVARAHHGSLAREQRVLIEEQLKAGELPALVATSSLELGIDMGAVDLVIQVESPRSVARGMQRIGRAGHQVDAPSRGRIFPKYRGDLLECAAVVSRMRTGAIEETRVPRLPLDVLAQQIVAMSAVEALSVDEIEATVRGAYPFAELSREQLEGVLDMLAGRYPSDEFAELRPRIVWDRSAGTVRGRDGARSLAVQNAGTIPDRGLFAVVLPDGARVGELDEEMVYEARSGQTFMLGASTWRIEEITRDRVIVTPAPGAPGALPFWKGEGVGRPFELGEAVGPPGPRAGGGGARAGRRPAARGERLRGSRRRQPGRLPRGPGGRDRGRAERPRDRDRALPRRDRRLAPLRADALRGARPRALGPGARGAPARVQRPGGPRDLGRRRHRRPPARRRRGAVGRRRADRAGRARGADPGRAGRDRPVRGPLPRERRPRPADPAPPPRPADAAVAAAPEGLVAAPGGAPLRQLPGDPRDLPRGASTTGSTCRPCAG